MLIVWNRGIVLQCSVVLQEVSAVNLLLEVWSQITMAILWLVLRFATSSWYREDQLELREAWLG